MTAAGTSACRPHLLPLLATIYLLPKVSADKADVFAVMSGSLSLVRTWAQRRREAARLGVTIALFVCGFLCIREI